MVGTEGKKIVPETWVQRALAAGETLSSVRHANPVIVREENAFCAASINMHLVPRVLYNARPHVPTRSFVGQGRLDAYVENHSHSLDCTNSLRYDTRP